MIYILYTIFFISCVVLIISVLLQPGKTDAGALFTSSVSGNAFGPRGTQTVLSKLTITAAVCFMLSALFISLPALSGTSSVLANNPETSSEAVTQPPITDLNTNADVNANALSNSAINSDVPANNAPAAVNSAVNTSPAKAPVNSSQK